MILYTFFYYFIHVYSPGARADKQTLEVKIMMSTESSYHFDHFLKQIALNTDFIHFFHVFPHVYIAPGQGLTTLCRQNSDVNRKALSLCLIVASFKENIFEV